MQLIQTFSSQSFATSGTYTVTIPYDYDFYEGKILVDWDDGKVEEILYKAVHEYGAGFYTPRLYIDSKYISGVDCVF